ncbi:MAG: carbon monoxide dehydrogenase, partial [Actinomycetota bacterium]
MAENEDLTACESTLDMLRRADEEEIETAFQRVGKQKGCAFGEQGTCCRICSMGPCRINPKKAAESRGVCGADID